jgi:membrane protease YdiL (CAAX protease family)
VKGAAHEPKDAVPRHGFEDRISRVRPWTLIPVLLLPSVAWNLLSDPLGVSRELRQQVFQLLLYGLLFSWWLWNAAPRPFSVQAAMGRPPNLAGWGVVAVALFGLTCLRFIWRLVPHGSEILDAFSSGGPFSYTAAKAAPTFFNLLVAVVLPPITEELVFRGTLFRKWRERWGPVMALLLTTVIFAVFHADHVGVLLSGLTYALVYTRTRSLWPPVVIHALGNGLLYGLDVLSYLWDGPKLINLRSPLEYGVFALVLLVGVVLWLGFVVKSWRTLGDPLPPDSLQPAPAAPSGSPEPTRVGV